VLGASKLFVMLKDISGFRLTTVGDVFFLLISRSIVL
jgi:hypothetical protein